jgi:hypothetical protein
MARAHRTYWRVRQKYRRAGYLGSVLGAFAAAAVIAPNVQSAEWAGLGIPLPLVVEWMALFLAAVLLPPLLSRMAWRWHRRRYVEDIYHIALR